MPQSLAAILVHVVFSTKNREPLIQPDIEGELFPYMATACHAANSPAILVNGTMDHVHMLVKLGRKTAIAALAASCVRAWRSQKSEFHAPSSWGKDHHLPRQTGGVSCSAQHTVIPRFG